MREVVASYLVREGFEVRELKDGSAVMETIAGFRPDLVVLDVMLPYRSGLDIVRELRMTSQVPVILLTARVEETDRVIGLELGADDYLTKPFSPRELAARVRSVLRRTGVGVSASSGVGGMATLEAPLVFDDLQIDLPARETFCSGAAVSLTAKEFDLLAFLAQHPRQVFSRAQLLHFVWDSDPAFQDPATVTVHVRRIRTKLGVDPDNPRWIATVFGVGYRFEP